MTEASGEPITSKRRQPKTDGVTTSSSRYPTTSAHPAQQAGVITSSMGSDTEEYQKILTRYDIIIDQLSSARCSGILANKLRAKKLITGPIYEQAHNAGPGVVESTRISPMVHAVLAKVELNTLNYYTFVGVLQEIEGAEDIVQYIIQAPDTTGALRPLLQQTPGCIAKYSKYLKDKYKHMPVLPDGDWPPSIGRQYTELSLIENNKRLPTADDAMEMVGYSMRGEIHKIVEKRKERSIEVADLFAPDVMDGPTKILMDGTPGIGKTTITRKICQDWGSDKVLQQYHLVLLLELRNQKTCTAKSVDDLLPSSNQELKQRVIQHIQATSGEHLLFIFDGYDELSDEERISDSIFFRILQGEELHNCSVLVTSRPYASDYLQSLNCISRHVEVIGFTQKQIQGCILQSIPNEAEAEGLLQVLKEHMDILSLCYTPLHCAIMLYVYKQEKCTLPNTLTKLLEIFILNALKRNARKLNQYRLVKRLRSLDKLPDPVRSQFEALCKIAYESFLVHKAVFSYEDLESVFPYCDPDTELESNLLSLMTASKSFTSTGEEVNYQFLHLSIQEFLAAQWSAISQSFYDQALFINDNLKRTEYRNVLKFLAGISQLKDTISDIVFPIPQSLIVLRNPQHLQLYAYPHLESSTSNPTMIYSDAHAHYPLQSGASTGTAFSSTERSLTKYRYTSYITFQKFLLLTQLIHESQNVTMYPRLLQLLDNQNELSFCFYRLMPTECIALAHFLTRIKHAWKVLGFNFCGLTDRSLEIFHKVSSMNYSGSQFEKVQLTHNASSFIKKLSLLPEITWFRSTKTVGIEGLQYPDGVSAKEIELHKIFSIKNLTDLTISVQNVPAHHQSDYLCIFAQFADALKTNKTLKWLSYEHPHTSDCSVFECTAAALKQNSSLHLSSQFKIQKGYPCVLSTTIQQGWKMCKMITFHLFQLPCMEHVQAQLCKTDAAKLILFQHDTLFKNCDNQTCCSIARKVVLQTFDNFLMSYVSEINLYHYEFRDVYNDSEHSAAEPAKYTSIGSPYTGTSKVAFKCAVSIVGASTSFRVTSLITKLSLLPRMVLFNNTTTVSIHNLKFSEGEPAKQIELQRILDMKCLTNLSISVESVAYHQLTGYLSIFTEFTNALKSNENLKRLLYEHPHSSDCSVFECTAAALKQNTSLHLNNQFTIQKGYPCELSMTVQGFKMCRIVAFYLFQLPCIKHVKQVIHIHHNIFCRTCNNQTCCTFSGERALQAFKNFLVATISKMDLFHSHVECSTEDTNNYSIGELFSDESDSTFSCTVNMMRSSAYFHIASLITKLSLLPSTALFNNTTTLSVHNLKFPDGVSAKRIELQRILDMRCLTNLSISVKKVAYQQLPEYLATFKEFTKALKSNENLKRLLYEHPHSSDCSVFECTAAALKRNTSLHLNDQYKIQKGYPCELSMTVQGFKMCRTVAFHLFQLPCMRHVKQVNVHHKTFFITCDNQTCYSLSSEGVLQSFENFLITTVSKTDLFHCDSRSHAEYSTKVTKDYSIRDLFSDRSDSTFSCTVNVMRLNTYFHIASLITKLSGLPKMALFNNTTTVNIHNLKYPEGVPTKPIELYKILDMRCLTNLKILVQSVPDHHRDEYLSMFTQFTNALRSNKTIEKLLYEHPYSSDCSIFECTATVLKQNTLLHLSSRYMIQMGYPCKLSWDKIHWDVHSSVTNDAARQVAVSKEHRNMCSTIAVHFFQVPCINHVKKLDFQNAMFTSCHVCSTSKDSVIRALKRFLKTSNAISELNLSQCNLTDEDAALIAAGLAENKSMQNMNISQNKLSAKAVLMLLKSNNTISYNTCDQTSGPDNIMGGVQTLSHILSQPVTMIDTNSIVTLSIPGVGRVEISSNGIQNLSILLQDPAAGELTAEGCACLFKTLNQKSSMKVTLALMSNIRSVSSGIISSAAAVCIFTSLEHNTSLEELVFSGYQHLMEDGSEAVGCALEKMLIANTGILVLMLKLCGVGNDVGKKIGMGLAGNKAVRVLNVSMNNIYSGGAVSIFTALKHNKNLEELDLSRNEHLIEGDAEAVGYALEKLLTVNKGVQILKLQQCGICDQIGKQIGVGLAGNMSLTVLNISHGSIHSSGAISIFTSLEHNSSLEELDLSWNWYLSKDDSEAVGCAIEKMLTVNKRIQTLKLQRCGICDQIGKKIGVGLVGNKSLRVLNISHGSIYSGGAVSIFTSLEPNTSLEELDLSWNFLTEGDSKRVGCALERMLTVNTGIQTLKLAHCRINDCIGKRIGVGLGGNTSLKWFDISWNSIQSDGAMCILKSLEHNTSVEEIDLSQNEQLTDDSEAVGCALERTLTINRGIQTLKQRQCGLSVRISKKIGVRLAGNESFGVMPDSDSEAALYYIPEKDPRMMNTMEVLTASPHQGHAPEQQKITIQWQTCTDTVQELYRGSAVSHGKLTYFNSSNSRDVHVYDSQEEQWRRLPDCFYYYSCLAIVNSQVTTVGGSHDSSGSQPTNSLVSLTGEGIDRKWVEHFPRMPTSRYYLAAACRGRTLMAAGGHDGCRRLTTVETLDTESLQWTPVSSLPHPMSLASTAVCNDKLYLLGGYDENGRTLSVLTCSIFDLLPTQQLDTQPEKVANQLTVWHRAADTPHYSSTAISVGEVLLAIGGESAAGEKTSTVITYDPISESWQDIGLSTPRSLPLVALLPNSKLIVAGGWGGSTKVEIGKLLPVAN